MPYFDGLPGWDFPVFNVEVVAKRKNSNRGMSTEIESEPLHAFPALGLSTTIIPERLIEGWGLRPVGEYSVSFPPRLGGREHPVVSPIYDATLRFTGGGADGKAVQTLQIKVISGTEEKFVALGRDILELSTLISNGSAKKYRLVFPDNVIYGTAHGTVGDAPEGKGPEGESEPPAA